MILISTRAAKGVLAVGAATLIWAVVGHTARADWNNNQWQDLPPLGPDYVLQGGVRAVPLHVRNTSDAEAKAFPVRGGVPFPQGALTDPENIRLLKPAGAEIPAQFRVMARWPDESIKWLLVDFQTDLRPRETAKYRLEFGTDVKRGAIPTSPLTVTADGRGFKVSTGPLSFTVAPGAVMRDVVLNGKRLTVGPVTSTLRLCDFEGNVSRVHRLSEGPDWAASVEESGPVHVIVKVTGWHRAAEREQFSPSVFRIHAYAGSAFVKIDHKFVFSGDPLKVRLKTLALDVPLRCEGKDALRVTFGGEDQATSHETTTAPLTLFQTNLEPPLDPPFTSFKPAYVVRHGADDKPSASGAKAPGWMVVRTGAASCLLGVRYFWELYPKGLEVKPGSVAVARAWLYPPQAEPLDLRKKDERFPERYKKLTGAAGPNEYLAQNNATGLARTHEILLDFGSDASGRRVRAFQDPPLLSVSTRWNGETGALGRFHPEDRANFPNVEKGMARMLEWLMRHQREWSNWYGFADFGGIQYQYLKDRGRWDNYHAKCGWNNDEINNCHTVFLAYLRTGNPEYFRFAETLVRHTMDIDTIHYHPEGRNVGLQHRHSFDHWSGHPHPSHHTYLLGLRDFYFLTGNRAALDNIRMAGDYIGPPSPNEMFYTPTRTADSPMWVLAAAYEATGEAQYKERMLKWLDYIEEAMRRMFNTPLGLTGSEWYFTDYRGPALILIERLLGDGRATKLLIKGNRDLKNTTDHLYIWWPQAYFATGDQSLFFRRLLDAGSGGLSGPVKPASYKSPNTCCRYLLRLPYHQAAFYFARPKRVTLNSTKGRSVGPNVTPVPGTHYETLDMSSVMNRNPLNDPYRHRGTKLSKTTYPLKPGQIGFDFGFPEACVPGHVPVMNGSVFPTFTRMQPGHSFLGLPFGATAEYNGTPFDLVNPFGNEGRGVLVLQADQVVTIPVKRKVSRLHFLGHVSGNYDYKYERIGAEYVITFKSGATQRVPLAGLRHYAPANFVFAELPDALLAGRGGWYSAAHMPAGGSTGLVVHHFMLTPAEPDVEEILLRDTGEGELFTLLAVTAEVPGQKPPPSSAKKYEFTFDKALPYDAERGFGWRYPERLTVLEEAGAVRSDEPNVLRVDLPDGWYRVELMTREGGASRHAVLMIETNEEANWDTFVLPETYPFDIESRMRLRFPVRVTGGHVSWRFSTKPVWQPNSNRWILHKLVFTPIGAPEKEPFGFTKSGMGPVFGWKGSKDSNVECNLRQSVHFPTQLNWEDFVRPYRFKGSEICEFVAEVPNGTYDAEIRIGRGFRGQQILDVLAEGEVVIASEMFKDQKDLTGRAEGVPPVRRFRTTVKDGQLNLRLHLRQRGGLWALYRLVLTPVPSGNRGKGKVVMRWRIAAGL